MHYITIEYENGAADLLMPCPASVWVQQRTLLHAIAQKLAYHSWLILPETTKEYGYCASLFDRVAALTPVMGKNKPGFEWRSLSRSEQEKVFVGSGDRLARLFELNTTANNTVDMRERGREEPLQMPVTDNEVANFLAQLVVSFPEQWEGMWQRFDIGTILNTMVQTGRYRNPESWRKRLASQALENFIADSAAAQAWIKESEGGLSLD